MCAIVEKRPFLGLDADLPQGGFQPKLIEFADSVGLQIDAHAEPRLPPVGSMTLEEVERAMILKGLEHHRGNLSRVAESLGMSRGALYRRLEKYQIKP